MIDKDEALQLADRVTVDLVWTAARMRWVA
jgi:hypothetical protein